MYFPTTHWSLLAKATLHGDTTSREALEELCRRYWGPLRQFIQARGHAEAEAQDLTQEFLLHLLERSALRKPDPLRGKFRSFLLGALAKFLSHERERRSAQKRGGAQPHLSVEALGENAGAICAALPVGEVIAFDRAWAMAVLRSALERVEHHFTATGRKELFAIVRAFLPGANVPPTYEEAAAQAGMSVAALNSEIHRLRRQFRAAVYSEVTATVSAPHEIEEEVAHLYHVLMDRGTDFQPPPES